MAAHEKQSGTEGYGFRNLLFFLLLYIFGSPFLAPYASLAMLAHTSLSLVMLMAVYAVRKQQNERSIAMALLLPLLAFYWLGIFDVIPFSRQGSYLLFCVYYGLLVYSFVFQIVHTSKITINVLSAALCLYLIIGLFWGTLYSLLYELTPGVYSGILLENMDAASLHIFNYFSFVTLTTLGYGDITPQSPGAASLCQMEAIVGQFFTAVVVAWLVGNYVSEKKDNLSD
jgi:voltage-gated potassium channel